MKEKCILRFRIFLITNLEFIFQVQTVCKNLGIFLNKQKEHFKKLLVIQLLKFHHL
jgi:hypothetical protein